jgi:hypothetical protein
MKEIRYKIYLYHGGERPTDIVYTTDIAHARKLVASAEHGEIYNHQNILIQ